MIVTVELSEDDANELIAIDRTKVSARAALILDRVEHELEWEQRRRLLDQFQGRTEKYQFGV